MRLLVGEEHPATVAVVAARCLVTRNTPRPGARHRDQRSREAILEGAHWAPFRALPGAQTVDLQRMRAVDRYLLFVEASGLPGGDEATFLAFVEDQISSMLLRLVRLGLEELLTSAHPAVVAAERARSRKETERKLRRQGDPVPTPPRPVELTASVAYEELPEAWKALFAKLRAGKKVRGRRRAPKTVDNMIGAARQYARSVRDAGLPAVLDEAGLRAFDDALATRETSATGRQIRFSSLQLLADQLPGHDAVVAATAELCGHYAREAQGEIKAKEARLAKLPELREIFAKANALLDAAETTTDRRRRTTLFVDAAALAVLSLVPLRDEDTVLFWGRHITWSGDEMFEASGDVDAQQACYRIDLRTSKTSESLAGPLAPILTPFLDALILQGQDPRLLPDLRRRAMAARGPVFPTLTGEARGPRSLSAAGASRSASAPASRARASTRCWARWAKAASGRPSPSAPSTRPARRSGIKPRRWRPGA